MKRSSATLVWVALTSGCSGSPAPVVVNTPAAAAAVAWALPPGVTREMIAAGDSIFNTKSCKNCHGIGGVGGARGPDLRDTTWIHISGSYAEIVSLVTTGFTKAELREVKYPFSMNPRGGANLTDEQIRSVAAYAWSLSHKQ